MPDVAIPCTKNFWVNMKKMMTGKDKRNTPARVCFPESGYLYYRESVHYFP